MILYVVYRYCKTPPQLGEKEVEAAKLPEVSLDMLKLGTVSSPEPIAVVRQTNKCTCGNDQRSETEDGQNGKQSSSATPTWTRINNLVDDYAMLILTPTWYTNHHVYPLRCRIFLSLSSVRSRNNFRENICAFANFIYVFLELISPLLF